MRKYKTHVRLFFLIFYFFISIIFSTCSFIKEPFPQQISHLTLKHKLEGDEAKEFVDKLHFNTVASENNQVAFYESVEGMAVIYISQYNDEERAQKNFTRMIQKISPKNSVFTGGEYIDFSKMKVYHLLGMRQSHYVFPYNNRLYWISADTSIAKRFVEDYISYIN